MPAFSFQAVTLRLIKLAVAISGGEDNSFELRCMALKIEGMRIYLLLRSIHTRNKFACDGLFKEAILRNAATSL